MLLLELVTKSVLNFIVFFSLECLGFFFTKYDAGHQRAASHAVCAFFAIGAAIPQGFTEGFKFFTIPCFGDRMIPQRNGVFPVLIKAAEQKLHIRTDVAGVARSLTGIEGFIDHAAAEVD